MSDLLKFTETPLVDESAKSTNMANMNLFLNHKNNHNNNSSNNNI